MSDSVTSVTISEDTVNRLRAAFKGLFPLPLAPNPEWTEGSELPERIPACSEQDWVKIQIRNFMEKTIKRWEQKCAKESISIDAVDGISM